MAVIDLATSTADLGKVRDFGLHFVFETYGVTVRIESNDERLLAKARSIAKKSFLERLEFIDDGRIPVDYTFGLALAPTGEFELWENGRFRSASSNEAATINFFTSYLRVTVAERATDRIFVHAGVVGWNSKAIVIPGNSFSGKTTLVAELLRNGAEYFSDEYAVFDETGRVHPFPRNLSIRVNGDRGDTVETEPTALTHSIGSEPLELGLAVFTQFVPASEWKPFPISIGNAITEMVPHTIPIRLQTARSLKVLNVSLSRAIMVKSDRPEAAAVARNILSFLDTDPNWS